MLRNSTEKKRTLTQKRQQNSANMTNELLSREISSDKDIFLKVSRFEGQVSVHLRHYYRNADGEMRPTKKGVCLNQAEFELLRDCLPECEAIFDDLKKASPKSQATKRRRYKDSDDETDDGESCEAPTPKPTKKQRKPRRH